MPLLQTLVDGFDGSSLNATLWSNFTSAGTTFAVGNSVISFTTTTTAGYAGFQTQSSSYDLTGSFAMAQVVNAGNQSLASLEVVAVEVDKDSSNKLFWYINSGSISAFKTVAGVQTSILSATYNSAVHQWFRIRQAGANVYYDYSADGLIWTNFVNLANPFVITAVFVAPSVGTFAAEATGTTVIFDNFNVVPPINYAPISIFSPLNPRFKFGSLLRLPPQDTGILSSGIAWLQNLADSVTSSDSIVNNMTLNKSDSVTSTESIVKNPTLNKSDSATSSDAISNRPTLNKSDSVTSTDSIVKNVTKALSDSVTSSESISKRPTKNLADSVTSSDTITTKAVVKNLVDSVTLVESLLLTDGNLSDVVNGFSAFTFHINDSVISSELISTTTVYKRSLADAVTAADAISNRPTKNLSDSAATAESIRKAPTLNKADSVTPSDATSKSVVLNKSDTATSSDSISNQPTKKLADTVTATDSLVKSLVKSLTDSVTSSDALSKAVGLNKADSVALTDAISNRFTKRLSDAVVSSDLSLRYLNGVLVTGSTSTLTNSVITTNGQIVLRVAGQEQQFIRLLDGRWALRVGKKLYMVL